MIDQVKPRGGHGDCPFIHPLARRGAPRHGRAAIHEVQSHAAIGSRRDVPSSSRAPGAPFFMNVQTSGVAAPLQAGALAFAGTPSGGVKRPGRQSGGIA